MPETEAQPGKVNFIRRVGEKLRITDSSEQKQLRVQEFNATIERMNQELLDRTHMLTQHSNACLSEIEYILGVSDRDPHPYHPITYTDCNHEKSPKFS